MARVSLLSMERNGFLRVDRLSMITACAKLLSRYRLLARYIAESGVIGTIETILSVDSAGRNDTRVTFEFREDDAAGKIRKSMEPGETFGRGSYKITELVTN